MRPSDEYDHEAQYGTSPQADDAASVMGPIKPGRKQPPSDDAASVAGPIKPQRGQLTPPPAGDMASLAGPSKPTRRGLPPKRQPPTREQSAGDGISFLTIPTIFASNYDDESTVGAMTTDSQLILPRIRQLGHQSNDVEAPSSMIDMDYSIYDLSIGGTEFEDVNLRQTVNNAVPSSKTDPQIVNIRQQGGSKNEVKDEQSLVTKPRRGLRLIEQVLLLVLIFIITFLAVYFFTLGRQ